MAKKLHDDVPTNSNADALAACLAWLAEDEVRRMRANAQASAKWRGFEAEGVDKEEAKRMHALSKLDDDTRMQKIETHQRYLTLTFDWQPNGQGDFTGALNTPKPAVAGTGDEKVRAARAFGDGYNSGRHGAAITDCKFPAGSEEYVRWRDGWSDGQADRKLAGKKSNPRETAASPRTAESKAAKKGSKAAKPAKPKKADHIDKTLTALDEDAETAGSA